MAELKAASRAWSSFSRAMGAIDLVSVCLRDWMEGDTIREYMLLIEEGRVQNIVYIW